MSEKIEPVAVLVEFVNSLGKREKVLAWSFGDVKLPHFGCGYDISELYPAEALRASFMEGVEAAAKYVDEDANGTRRIIAEAIRAIKYPEGK